MIDQDHGLGLSHRPAYSQANKELEVEILRFYTKASLKINIYSSFFSLKLDSQYKINTLPTLFSFKTLALEKLIWH